MRYFSVAVVMILAGCASHSGVISTGNGEFMASKQQGTGLPGLGNMKAELISEGNQHCKAIGGEFELLSSKDSPPPYVLGNYPRSEITFRCRPNH